MDARDEAYRLGYGDEYEDEDETRQERPTDRSRALDRADETLAASGDAWARERGLSD